jgi:arabinan endo-1,5-alpha-L-arabinosidase
MHWFMRRRGVLGIPLVALLAVSTAFLAGAGPVSASGARAGVYRNPVIPETAPDPAVIKALDGYYYLIATSDAQPGGAFHILPTWRSTDLVHWQFVGDGMMARPSWTTPDAGLWAPDIQYFNGRYYLYYTASDTRPLPRYGTRGGSAIGVAVADSPAGPWQDAGDSAGPAFATGPLVAPRPCVFTTDPNCSYWTIDPAVFTDRDGQHYLYFGSFFGGTVVERLNADGLHVSGPLYQVGHWDRYEGTYVIRHDVGGQAYYYNFSSSANCCLGPNTAYSVVVSRATSPLGPFVDQNGIPMELPLAAPVPTTRPADDPAGDNVGGQAGGYPTLKPNGNRWHGVGHNAIVTDLSGRDWIVYHGTDRANGWVDGLAPGVRITYRQLLIDPIEWTADGWPVVNGGRGPSDGWQRAPVTRPAFGDDFNGSGACGAPGGGSSLSDRWRQVSGSWRLQTGSCVTGGFVEQSADQGGVLVSGQTVGAGSRTECDLRLEGSATGRYGCLVSYEDGHYLAAFLDPRTNALTTAVHADGSVPGGEQSTPLPRGFAFGDWHHLTIDQLSPNRYAVTVSNYGRDPLAVQRRTVSGVAASGRVGLVSEGARAAFDNVDAARLDLTPAPAQTTPSPGERLRAFSDEFSGPLGAQWSWVREDAARHSLGGGSLSITTHGDLYRGANDAANLLLEAQPAGDYVAETKMTFDPNRNYQQAGLLVYSDDDHYIKVGAGHFDSLSKVIAGYESLEPQPSGIASCDVQPAPGSNVAVTTYSRDRCPNEGESWDYPSNGAATANGGTATDPRVTTWIRVYRHGNLYSAYFSLDGRRWVKGTSWTLTAAGPTFPVRIGLFSFAGGSPQEVPAEFDYFRVSRLDA